MVISLLKDRRLLMVLCLSLFMNKGIAQQFTQFSSYLLNSAGINAGYVGSNDGIEFLGSHRKQWINVPGSPQTSLFNVSGFAETLKMGLGGILLHDRIGQTNRTYLSVAASYRVKTNKGALQLGLNGGIVHYKQKLENLEIVDQLDEVFDAGTSIHMLPTLGTGAYYFTETFYVGISSPDFLESKVINKKPHFYGSIGKVFDVGDELHLKPSSLIKYSNGAPVQFDFSGTLFYKSRAAVGASLRTKAGFVVFGQVSLTKDLIAALAYDRMTNGLSVSEKGTYELTLSYSFKTTPSTVFSPRYF